jgi:hypothetical protein
MVVLCPASSVVRDAVRTGAMFTSASLEQLGATRCEPRDLRQCISAAARPWQAPKATS